MSSKRARERRREEQVAEEAKGQSGDQRQRALRIGGVAAAVVVAVAVALVVASSGGGGGDTDLEEVETSKELVGGIPQDEMAIGDPKAKVTLIEFGDLQCTACAHYAQDILPEVIENQVRAGVAKIDFRNLVIIGDESIPAGEAAVAAGEQGRAWQFLEIFYRNQGGENSGYVTEEFLEAVAKAAGVPDLAKWNRDRKSKKVEQKVIKTEEEARRYGFSVTPSFAIDGPSGGVKTLTPEETESPEAVEAAIASSR